MSFHSCSSSFSLLTFPLRFCRKKTTFSAHPTKAGKHQRSEGAMFDFDDTGGIFHLFLLFVQLVDFRDGFGAVAFGQWVENPYVTKYLLPPQPKSPCRYVRPRIFFLLCRLRFKHFTRDLLQKRLFFDVYAHLFQKIRCYSSDFIVPIGNKAPFLTIECMFNGEQASTRTVRWQAF